MIWYPYEQLKTMKAPYEIVDANGVYLYTKDQKLIDSVSSWWSVIHGYKHPVINQAIISQVEKFSHVMLGPPSNAGPAEHAQLIMKSEFPNTISPLVPRSMNRLNSGLFQIMLTRVPAVISPPT